MPPNAGTVNDFYRVPDPLPKGAPGALIRLQPIRSDGGEATVRVMYHSRDIRNRDRAVTGVITYRTEATAPKDGWPVVAWAHGTTGLASPCAPSRSGSSAPGFGIDGVRVATDYIGRWRLPPNYVGPEVEAKEDVIDNGCLNDIVNAMVTIPAERFYDHDPLKTEPARSLVQANDPGHVKVAAPLLVIYGTADVTVVPERVHALFDRLCKLGQVTDLDRVDGATHDSVVGQGGNAITTWLRDRLSGQSAPDACADGWR